MISNIDEAVYIENIVEQDPGFKAHSTIDFTVNPSDGNYIKLDTTQFTFKDSTANSTDVLIGSTISDTIDNFLANGSLPTTVTLTKVDTDKVYIEYNTIGDSGNNFTLASDFITVDSHLNGGTDVPDPDWVKESGTTISYKPKELRLYGDTSSTALITYDKISENDKIKLIDGNNIVKGKLGSVNTNNGTAYILDVFKDNSGVALYGFDGNAKDLGGNYDGIWDGTESYEAGKFDEAAKPVGHGTGGGSDIKLPDGLFTKQYDRTYSFWFKYLGAQEDVSMILCTCGGTANDEGFMLLIQKPDSNNNCTFTIYVSKSDAASSHDFSIPDTSTFRHYVITQSGTTFTLYVDGDNKGNWDATSDYMDGKDSGYATYIGRYSDYNEWHFDGLIDQMRFFNKVLSDSDINTLYNEQIPKYTADISNLNLSNAPSKAFFLQDITTSICVESNKNRVINEPLIPLNIDVSTADNGSNLVTSDKITEGDEIIVNDIAANVGSVSYDSNTNLYTVSLNNHNLTEIPYKAYKKGRFALEKISSTTTQFVGKTDKSGLLTAGDKVIIDGSTEVTISNVTEEDDNGDRKYTIDIPEQSSAPNTCEIPSRDIVLSKKSEDYDNDNNKFDITYNDIELQGRAINRKIQAQIKDIEVLPPFITNMWKKG